MVHQDDRSKRRSDQKQQYDQLDSGKDVSETGLRMYRTGESAVTDTGELLLMFGNVNVDICIPSEALKN